LEVSIFFSNFAAKSKLSKTPTIHMSENPELTTSASAKERRALILRLLEKQPEVVVTELARSLNTSEVTIRKDLTTLQDRGLILRTRGGAIRKPTENLSEDTAIGQKRMFNFREKERIGEAAARLIKDGDYIMLDSGTTTMEIAKNLDRFTNLTILTNAMNIAEELMKYERFTVITLGGHVRINSHSTVGPLAIAALRNFSDYKLFLGVDSFSLEDGISTPNLEEALLNQQMISQAGKTYAVFDSSKFNKRSYVRIASLNEIDAVITDRGIPTGISAQLKEAGVKLILV